MSIYLVYSIPCYTYCILNTVYSILKREFYYKSKNAFNCLYKSIYYDVVYNTLYTVYNVLYIVDCMPYTGEKI